MTPEEYDNARFELWRQFRITIGPQVQAMGLKRYKNATIREAQSVTELLFKRYEAPGKITPTRIRWAWRVVKK